MKITLRLNGEDKTFVNDFVSARLFRKALELNEKFKEISDLTEQFDLMEEYVVSVFNGQFTADDLIDGLPAGKYSSELMRVFNEVLALEGFAVQGTTDEGKQQEAPMNR